MRVSEPNPLAIDAGLKLDKEYRCFHISASISSQEEQQPCPGVEREKVKAEALLRAQHVLLKSNLTR